MFFTLIICSILLVLIFMQQVKIGNINDELNSIFSGSVIKNMEILETANE